jgi:galactose oxidase
MRALPRAQQELHSLQVLTWSAYLNDNFGIGRSARTQTATYHPSSGAVSRMTVTNTNHDMFCPGISMLGNGDIVVTGGDNAEKTSIFSTATNEWLPGPDMNVPRGYQASTALANGDVRVLRV